MTSFQAWVPQKPIQVAIVAVLPVLVFLTMTVFRSKNKFPVSGRTIIITGGSQGLGLSLAKLLSSKGANIIIVAQDPQKLQNAINAIKESAANPTTQRFLQLSFDLRSPESAVKILEQVTAWNNGQPADIVWNCAGNSHPAFFADASIETLRGQFDTVYWSAAYMAHAVLNQWKQPRGNKTLDSSNSSTTPPSSSLKSPILPRHLIFTSSVVAFFPIAGYTPYTAPKAAMKSLADSLRQEVAVYNGHHSTQTAQSPSHPIKISIVYPMGISTPGFETEEKIKPQITKKLEEDDVPQQPDEVAKVAVSALEAGKHEITTATLGHVMRGVGMAATPRTGVVDVFWNWLGSLVVIFVATDFLAKCRRWGKENGMKTGP
jgi:3-dehydrosphinganine reductase